MCGKQLSDLSCSPVSVCFSSYVNFPLDGIHLFCSQCIMSVCNSMQIEKKHFFFSLFLFSLYFSATFCPDIRFKIPNISNLGGGELRTMEANIIVDLL